MPPTKAAATEEDCLLLAVAAPSAAERSEKGAEEGLGGDEEEIDVYWTGALRAGLPTGRRWLMLPLREEGAASIICVRRAWR